MTIFSKIIAGEIPAQIVHETQNVLAFRDISPQAPLHVLIIPKTEIASMAQASVQQQALLGELLLVASEVARKEGFESTGYRVVINTGRDGGQTVDHLHLHLLAGRALTWPPG